ncbi:MAG: hypothetical protein HQK55_00800 [Deltaproteobacteria bacterium]|nr:hypothetical protein [Deltaproteobacteria bacterium]
MQWVLSSFAEFDKNVLGVAAGVFSFIGYVPYFHGILKGRVRPHIFSWVIWTLLAGIVFFAQVAKGAGPGAWATGLSGILCAIIVVMSFWYGDKRATWSDWFFFLVGLTAIPVWQLTRDPQWAVILVAFVNSAAYYPTFRKSYAKPREEALSMYFVSSLKNVLSVMAIESYSLTTVLYPVVATVLSVLFIGMSLQRRRALEDAKIPSPV